MGAGKKTKNARTESSWTVNSTTPARNLRTTEIGAIIFGCKHNTIQECYNNLLFGLPAPHFAYVRNVKPGMPLFLFNYSDRRLHGVFEAVSQGQLNISPYAWTDGSYYTPYEAQVKVRVVTQCNPINEESFKPIIASNYYDERLFWFELDKVQTDNLMSKFHAKPREIYKRPPLPQGPIAEASNACAVSGTRASIPEKKWSSLFKTSPDNEAIAEASSDLYANAGWESVQPMHESNWDNCSNFDPIPVYVNQEVEHSQDDELSVDAPSSVETNVVDSPTKAPCLDGGLEYSSVPEDLLHSREELTSHNNNMQDSVHSMVREHSKAEFTSKEIGECSSDCCSRLFEEVKKLKICCSQQEQKISVLEQALVESKIQMQNLMHLNNHQMESSPLTSADCFEDNIYDHKPIYDASIYIVGGYNGDFWLSSLTKYSPLYDEMKPLRPMPFLRSYASIAKLNGELFVLGGVHGNTWYDTVESYIPSNDIWVTRPSMNGKKESLAGVSLWDRLYALGGGDGVECFSDVEFLDLNGGRWITSQSMQQKRFDPAAAETNGALYVVGGYDGVHYLSTAERFDPREGSWNSIKSMSVGRGCHSLSVLNGKLYAVGGYDGSKMVSSVEAFDPRVGAWMSVENMKGCRGSFGASVVGEKIYAIGGVGENDVVLGTIECYKEGTGWQVTDLKGIGERGFFSSIVM
ncbi:ring canal kelch homolog [Impatiens glandulifera]|uniref:ring canal kelch homolog n=1 Tax=Impatiens glandulifera TaxID=253017 RepID=UPI001FB071D6|nr:ring canal kelch homolog [Impatiens glandulifera]